MHFAAQSSGNARVDTSMHPAARLGVSVFSNASTCNALECLSKNNFGSTTMSRKTSAFTQKTKPKNLSTPAALQSDVQLNAPADLDKNVQFNTATQAADLDASGKFYFLHIYFDCEM